MGGLLSGVTFSVRLRANLRIEGILGDLDLFLLDDSLLLLLYNICRRGLTLDILLLDLLLNLIRGVRLRVFCISFNLQRRLTHSQVGLFLSDVKVSIDASFIGRLISGGLSLRDLLVGTGLSNLSVLADSRDIRNAKVIDGAVLIGKALNVEGDNLKTHLSEILVSVVLHTLCKRIAIGNDILKLHLTDNGAQVSFKRIANLIGDFVDIFVQEVACSGLQELRRLGCNANLNGGVRLHVDEVVCGYII